MDDYKTRSEVSTSHEWVSQCGRFRINLYEHSTNNDVQWGVRAHQVAGPAASIDVAARAPDLKTAKARADAALELLRQLAQIVWHDDEPQEISPFQSLES